MQRDLCLQVLISVGYARYSDEMLMCGKLKVSMDKHTLPKRLRLTKQI